MSKLRFALFMALSAVFAACVVWVYLAPMPHERTAELYDASVPAPVYEVHLDATLPTLDDLLELRSRVSELDESFGLLEKKVAVLQEHQVLLDKMFKDVQGPKFGASAGYVFVGGEQRYQLYTRAREYAQDWTAVPAGTWTTIYTMPALVAGELNVYAALAIITYDQSDAAVSCDAGYCDAVIRRYVPGRFQGNDFCRPDAVCASGGSFDAAEDAYVTSLGVMAGAQARISWSSPNLLLQVNPPVTARAAGSISGQALKPVGDSGGSSGGSSSGSSSGGSSSGSSSGGGSPPVLTGISQTGISPLQTTTNGPMAGGQNVTISGSANMSTVTTCHLDTVACTGISCGSSTCTCTSAAGTGVNSGNAALGDVTCTGPGGTSAPLTNAYLYLSSVQKVDLRGDALALSGSNITSAIDLTGNTAWSPSATTAPTQATAAQLNSQLAMHLVTLVGSTFESLNGPTLASLTAAQGIFVYQQNGAGNQCNDIDSLDTNGSLNCWSFSGSIYIGFASTVRQCDPCAFPGGITGGAWSSSAGYVIDILSQSGNWAMQINNASVFTTASNTVGLPSSPFIGENATGFAVDYDYGEVMIGTAAFSAGDLISYKAYFNNRYALNFN